MFRRLATAATVLSLVQLLVWSPWSSQAVTGNLGELDTLGGVLPEGDKKFFDFIYTINTHQQAPGTTARFLEGSAITVSTFTNPDGSIGVSIPLMLGASATACPAGGCLSPAELALVNVTVGFDVEVVGSDLITSVTVTATGDAAVGDAGSSAVVSFNGTGNPAVFSPGTATIDLPDAPFFGVSATVDAIALRGATDSSAELDVLTFTFRQTTPTGTVPEPASLTLIAGGLGVLVARRLLGRQRAS